MVTPMRLATAGVSDLDTALKLFRDVMELKVERKGPVPAALLKAWKIAPGTKARMAVLSNKGYPIGLLRLVEYTPTPKQKVRLDHGNGSDTATDVGPKALDFYVADPIMDSVRKIEAAGYKFRSPPVKHQIATSVSEECLFSGPDGIPILIMVGHVHPRTSMRKGIPDAPFSEIPTISICAGDLERTRAFYGDVLRLKAVTDAETPEQYRELVDKLTGVPLGTRVHFLMYGRPPEASGKILLVHFFEQTGKRLKGRMKPGNLGFSLLTHDTDEIDALHARLKKFGAEIVTPPTPIAGDGKPYRMMMAKGPNEEMFEFTDFSTAPGDKVRPAKKAKPAKKKVVKKKLVKKAPRKTAKAKRKKKR